MSDNNGETNEQRQPVPDISVLLKSLVEAANKIPDVYGRDETFDKMLSIQGQFLMASAISALACAIQEYSSTIKNK